MRSILCVLGLALCLPLAGCDDGAPADADADADGDGDGDGDADADGDGDGDGDADADADGDRGSWEPPIGIPRPEFCVEETAEVECATCTRIEADSVDGLADLAAGTVVELSGGPFTSAGGDPVVIGGAGTAERPIFVRGAGSARPVISRPTFIEGSFVVVENIDFDFAGGAEGIAITGDHLCLRHSEAHNLDPGHNSTVVSIEGSDHVVLYDDHIHDNGDFDVVGEQDVHGVGATESHRIWIVDSHLHRNRGDSIQFGHQAGNTLGAFYIGRNDIHDDGENCVDIKEASDVVISENRLHSPAVDMPAVVLHDCPVNAAAIYNEVYDAAVGVNSASLEDACAPFVPVTVFALRNTFHDISDASVQAWGSGKRYFVAGNVFDGLGTSVEIDEADATSVISEGDEGLDAGFAAFLEAYGLDISGP
jgi:hypothetical protein